MPSFFENPWIISAGAGIISSISSFFIIKAIDNNNNSKHLEQVNSANREIIQTLRPYVVEKGLPEKDIVNAIIVSAARRHNVKDEELYSISIICEELIHEIIEDVYVSSEQKREYSLQLTEYLRRLSEEQPDAKETNLGLTPDIEKELTQSNRMAAIMSACMGIAAGIVVGLLSFISSHADPAVSEDLINTMQFSLIIPVIPSAIILICFFAVLHIVRFLKKSTKNRPEESDAESSDDK